MPPVPNRDRRSAAADAAERRAAAAAPREREDAAVAGQAAAVERLVAMGFTAEQARCGLAQGFPSVEEAIDFLVAASAADGDVQSVLAVAAVRPAGTSPLWVATLGPETWVGTRPPGVSRRESR